MCTANVTTMSSKQLVTVLLLTTVHVRSLTHCDNGWVEYTGRCFLFQTHLCSFAEAENHCLQHGGHLTSVHGSDEANFLRREIKMMYRSLSNVKHDLFWIGHNGRDGWTDGTEMDYKGWNETTTRPNGETSQFISIGWHWSVDTDSTAYHYYICRKHPDSSRPVYCPRSSVRNHLDGHCYGFVGKNVTWDEAEMACSNMATYNTSGYLVTIDNYNEAMFLSAFPSRLLRNRHTWVNYQDIGGNGNWSRRDCTNQTYVPQESMRNYVDDWRRGRCGVVDIISDTWTGDNCYETNAALCEFEPVKRDTTLTRQDRSCLETFSVLASSSTTAFIDKIRLASLSTSGATSPLRRKRFQSTDIRGHVTNHNFVKSKRDVYTSFQSKSINLSKASTQQNRTEYNASESLDSFINDVRTDNVSGNFNTKNISLPVTTEVNRYENNTTISSPVTPNTVHVVIGILGIVVFVILICGLFINDLKSMTSHIIRGEEGRASRDNQALQNHTHMTVNANYQNEHLCSQTLSQ